MGEERSQKEKISKVTNEDFIALCGVSKALNGGRIQATEIAKAIDSTPSAVRSRACRLRNEIEAQAEVANLMFVQVLEQRIEDVMAAITPAKIGEAKLRDLAISLGVLLDKRQTLLGKDFSTGRMPNYKVRFSQRTPDGTERSVEVRREGGQGDTPIEE